jgi:hypothetical protein
VLYHALKSLDASLFFILSRFSASDTITRTSETSPGDWIPLRCFRERARHMNISYAIFSMFRQFGVTAHWRRSSKCILGALYITGNGILLSSIFFVCFFSRYKWSEVTYGTGRCEITKKFVVFYIFSIQFSHFDLGSYYSWKNVSHLHCTY